MTDAQPSKEPQKFRQWLPSTSLSGLKQEINDLFDGFFHETVPAWRGDQPRLDLIETPAALEITVDLPGWKADEIDIDVGDQEITFAGRRSEQATEPQADRRLHRVERRQASFSRTIALPCAVNKEQVKADLAHGVLRVELAKRDGPAPRQVRIKPMGSPPPGVG